jgi:hypothetical protein
MQAHGLLHDSAVRLWPIAIRSAHQPGREIRDPEYQQDLKRASLGTLTFKAQEAKPLMVKVSGIPRGRNIRFRINTGLLRNNPGMRLGLCLLGNKPNATIELKLRCNPRRHDRSIVHLKRDNTRLHASLVTLSSRTGLLHRLIGPRTCSGSRLHSNSVQPLGSLRRDSAADSEPAADSTEALVEEEGDDDNVDVRMVGVHGHGYSMKVPALNPSNAARNLSRVFITMRAYQAIRWSKSRLSPIAAITERKPIPFSD